MSDDEGYVFCLKSDLAREIGNAVRPIVEQTNLANQVCQQALDIAKERTGVLEVVYEQNVRLREAVIRLLEDYEPHKCGQPGCPVEFARAVIRGPVKQ